MVFFFFVAITILFIVKVTNLDSDFVKTFLPFYVLQKFLGYTVGMRQYKKHIINFLFCFLGLKVEKFVNIMAVKY